MLSKISKLFGKISSKLKNLFFNLKTYISKINKTLTASVIVSTLSIIMLMFQTAIIYRQTELLAGQTEAAQFEQSEKLRTRAQELVNLTQRLGDVQQFFEQLAEQDIGCRGQCRNQRLVDLVKTLSGRQFRMDGSDESFTQSRIEALEIGDAFEIYALWVKFRFTLPRVLGSDDLAYLTLTRMAEESAIRCDVKPETAMDFSSNIKQLLPWSWVQYKLDPDVGRSISDVVLVHFPRLLSKELSRPIKTDITSATLSDLNKEIKIISEKASDSLGVMISGCQSRIKKHIKRLKQIDEKPL